MILSLHRSQKMAVNITKPGFETRAFVFDVALGLRLGRDTAKDDLLLDLQVDPLSGMLVNLVQVDQILQELAQLWDSKIWSSLAVLLMESQKFLEARVARESAFVPVTGKLAVEELCLHEKRGFWLKSQPGKPGNLLSGREEIRELDSKLFRIRSQYSFNENHWEQQNLKVSSVEDLFSEQVFLTNPGLDSIEIEDLATSEKWQQRVQVLF